MKPSKTGIRNSGYFPPKQLFPRPFVFSCKTIYGEQRVEIRSITMRAALILGLLGCAAGLQLSATTTRAIARPRAMAFIMQEGEATTEKEPAAPVEKDNRPRYFGADPDKPFVSPITGDASPYYAWAAAMFLVVLSTAFG